MTSVVTCLRSATRQGIFLIGISPASISRAEIKQSLKGKAQHRRATLRCSSSVVKVEALWGPIFISPPNTLPLQEPHAPFLQP